MKLHGVDVGREQAGVTGWSESWNEMGAAPKGLEPNSLFWRFSVVSTKSKNHVRFTVVSALLGSMALAPMAQAFEIDKETGGAVIGAILGAATGHQFGDGKGRDAMTVIGAIAGAYVGGKIGADIDERDRRQAAQAEIESFQYRANERRSWDGRRYGSRRVVGSESYWTRQGRHSRFNDCRESYSTIRTRNGVETYGSVWCQTGSGWNRIEDRSVIETISWCDSRGCTTEQTTTTARVETSGGHRSRMAPPAGHESRRDASIPAWIVSEGRMYQLMRDLNREGLDSGRNEILRDVYNDLRNSGEFFTLDQVAQILQGYAFDSGRNEALRLIKPLIDLRYGSRSNIMLVYSYDSGRDEARRILR